MNAPGWKRLNAYVDGEISAEDRAEIADSVALDRDLAGHVAALSRLKAAARETLEPYRGPAVEILKRSPRRRLWVPVAVSIAGAVLLTGLALGYLQLRDEPTNWVAAFAGTYTSVLEAEKRSSASPPSAGAILVGLARLGPDAFVPDLASARLRILQTEISGAGAVSVLYGGERGCRLGLWIMPAPEGLRSALESTRAGPYQAYSWRVGALAYVMLSQIEPARFRVIAETAHRVTTERRAINEAMAAALAESRRKSTPCTA